MIYSDNFKMMILARKRNGEKVSALNREFQLGKNTIACWEKEYAEFSIAVTKGQMSETQKKYQEIKARIKFLEMENDILKKQKELFGYNSSPSTSSKKEEALTLKQERK